MARFSTLMMMIYDDDDDDVDVDDDDDDARLEITHISHITNMKEDFEQDA